jgi:hypothetical protein
VFFDVYNLTNDNLAQNPQWSSGTSFNPLSVGRCGWRGSG